jgi:hypothetical protein
VCMAQLPIAFGGPPNARGLAVLCGWGGSTLKNVCKYASVWHKLGWRTATAAMSIDMTFFPGSWTAANEVARTLAKECRLHRERHGPDALIASHALSNGGVMLMLSVLEEASSDEPVRFDGAVYDSAPSSKHLPLPMGAPLIIISAGLPAAETAKSLALHVPYCLFTSLLLPIRTPPPPIGLFPKLFGIEMNPPRPELFIYGEEDRLIPPDQVEAFISLRVAQGSAVQTSGRLACSPHVSHLRSYPEVYEKALASFAASLENPRPVSRL